MTINNNKKYILEELESIRKKLLDLTANNKILNFPIDSKTTSIKIIDELPNQITEKLLKDQKMEFLPVPEPKINELIKHGYIEIDEKTKEYKNIKPNPSATEWAKIIGLDTSYNLPKQEANNETEEKHEDNAIQVLMYPYESESKLRSLKTKSNTALEEKGANILFLSLGFLEWYESKNSNKSRLAPLFMIPVSLSKNNLDKKSGIYKYSIQYTGEDIIQNLSLREKLLEDFNIALPEMDENTTPEKYFFEVNNIINDKDPRWNVKRYGALTLLDFGKMLMYLDLDPNRWPDNENNIINHPIINRFFTNSSNEASGFRGEYPIDNIKNIHNEYPLIYDADSSQHSALIDAINGSNLVIEGPPGTGKSQTITNLIAAALYQNKKVLFISEKLAALDVVKERLDKAGLGEFCLELHSHKAQKRKILENINSRMLFKPKKIEKIEPKISRYEDSKRELNSYAVTINTIWKNTGKTIQEILSASTRYKIELNDIDLDKIPTIEKIKGSEFSEETFLKIEEMINEFCQMHNDIIGKEKYINQHPWFGIKNDNINSVEYEEIINDLIEWNESLNSIKKINETLINLIPSVENNLSTIEDIEIFIEELLKIPEPTGLESINSISNYDNEKTTNLKTFLNKTIEIQRTNKDITKYIKKEKLNNFIEQEKLEIAFKILQSIGPKDNLNEYKPLLDKIYNTEKLLIEVYKKNKNINNILPKEISMHLNAGYNEFLFFNNLLKCLTNIDIDLLQYRNSIFESEKIDSYIKTIKILTNKASKIIKEINDVYDTSEPIDNRNLKKIKICSQQKTNFRFLNKEWRESIKILKSISMSKSIKNKILIEKLPKLIELKEIETTLNENVISKKLGPLYNGLNTDIKSIEDIRSWYKGIINQYNGKFINNQSMASNILKIEESNIKYLKELYTHNYKKEADEAINNLLEIINNFPNIKKNITNNNLLITNNGTLNQIYTKMNKSLLLINSFTTSHDIDNEKLKYIILTLKKLKQDKEYWYKNKDILNGFKQENYPSIEIEKDNNNDTVTSTVRYCEWINNSTFKKEIMSYFLLNKDNSEAIVNLLEILNQYNSILIESNKQLNNLKDLTNLNSFDWGLNENVDNIISKNNKAIQNRNSLRNWVNYLKIKNTLIHEGYGEIINKINNKNIKTKHIPIIFKAAVYRQLSEEIFTLKPSISNVCSSQQISTQNTFIKYDNELKLLQRQKIAKKITSFKPPKGNSGGKKSEYTEMALINNEIGKKSRHTSIRQLIKRAGESLLTIKPCFMMSPLSVAHYLEPGDINFDLIVIDEASQVKPEDSLGVIARGKQVVVVGDPKQLPPTSFFDRTEVDNDEDNSAISENKSILDATIPIFPLRRLRWHYRSQHENLIAFSNKNFYDNDLVVFPSPFAESPDYGLKYTFIKNGKYVNNHNIEEARIIANAVLEHGKKNPNESLGIVAMNASQREQIERSVEEIAKQDSESMKIIESLRNHEDGLFIKNIENVQGDERDVIFISFTYGPSEVGGRVAQRFGPINSEEGWKRLNVLFTRAKKRMHTFTSMLHSDILINEKSKKGVYSLRGFLNFSETGNIAGQVQHTNKQPDSDFEIAVINELQKYGYECEPQVGVAGFFIDIAVKDKNEPGRYLIGVECDGATYHSAKSARDRDRLRQEILENLGWTIHRIWSTDWFSDPDREIQTLVEKLKEIKPIKNKQQASILNQETDTVTYTKSDNLSEQLHIINEEIIIKKFPKTAKGKRLLRESMIEAMCENKPKSKTEFLEKIPEYLRINTQKSEANEYLDFVLKVIAEMEEENDY